MSRRPDSIIAAALGGLLAAFSLPLSWSALVFLPLSALLLFLAGGEEGRGVVRRAFWAAAAYHAVHLWWLTAFLAKIFGFAPLGVLALGLYAIEGGFFALLAALVVRVFHSTAGRVWGLAGGWIILEWLRFLGPLAFPWPTLGYGLLSTPVIQIADLGGVLLGSVLLTFSAASLATLLLTRRRRALLLAGVAWLGALVYGLTREPGQGLEGRALLQRTAINSFAKASEALSPMAQFERYQRLTQSAWQPGEVVVWTETAVYHPDWLKNVPYSGLYGTGSGAGRANKVSAWDGQAITSDNDKARPVPFGEFFPFQDILAPLYHLIERRVGFVLDENLPPADHLHVLPLNGVVYGAYVCYDSVFPWVARGLARQGAQVLVNVSNDGWYAGWGVQQHFMMGRVRAIENRRWVLRSVNEGITAAIDDLGRPVQILDRGEDVLHARFKVLNSVTFYQRFGDLPALVLALLMIGYGLRLERSEGRREIY